MKRDHFSDSKKLDASIQELIQGARQQQNLADEPTLRMTNDIRHAYQAEADEDARSLERVLSRLAGDQAESSTKILVFSHVSQQSERIATMQSSFHELAQSKISKKWQQRVGLLAAVLFLTLLIGGLVTAFSLAHAGSASPSIAQGASLTSNVITSVALSNNENQTSQIPTVQHFTTGQMVWLNSTIDTGKVKGSGTLTVKWYENGHLYATSTRGFQAPEDQSLPGALKAITLHAHQAYGEPGDGKAEVYWNGQLVTTISFVIDQAPKK